jgi:Concanavalin A-like lectin/glucanases superfamily/Secretion system C-terminal sorting domain
MKKLFLLLSILFFVKITMAQTLVASYPFNGNANDAVGTANGTVSGATLTTDRFGNANSAYNFNGNADYIGGVASSFSTTDRTISLWFNADAGSIATNTPCLFSYGGNPCGSSFLMLLNNVNNGKYQAQGHCNINLNEYSYTTLPEANWYNWVVTINGTTIKMFINGVLVNTTTSFTTPTTVSGKDFYIGTLINNNGIGRFNPSGGYYFKGKLDDIKIYNGALTDAQIFDNYISDVKKPGSGNGLQLTRTGDRATDPWINIGSGYDFGAQPFTYETWVKRDDLHATANNYGIVFIVSEPNNGWGVGIDNSNLLFFTKVGVNGSFSTGTIADTKWHHVAVVYTGTQIQFFIDGVAAGTNAYTDNFTSGGNYTIGARQFFGNTNGDQTINGMIDETRIWKNVALTQTQIRDWMCKKVTSAHPAYNNLFAYFRFDEGSSNTSGGFNGNFGMLVNTPTWQTSGAALGDASAHDYINAIKTANISHPNGENFAVTPTSGSPEGIQVYRVDEQPNTLTGASGVGVNSKYFGVFQAGGTSPQYTAVYNYNGNPSVTPAIESQLRLNKRNDNAATSWTLLPDVANEPANTITVTGQSTEYILGRVGGVLPITSFNFNAVKKDKTVLLTWNYTNNNNVFSYDVEKSESNTSFSKTATITAKENNIAYQFIDNNPATGVNYYRIKIITKTGSIAYSQIIKIDLASQSTITISPNPASSFITITTASNFNYVYIIDVNGRVVKQFTKATNNKYAIPSLSKGMYLVRLINEKEIVASSKIVIE